MKTIEFTPDQQEAIDYAVDRIRAREQITTIGGYAGTGKTTIVGRIVEILRESYPEGSFAFACYTGKAKGILNQKLEASNSLRAGDFIGTLHQLLYKAKVSYVNDDRDPDIIKKITKFEDGESKGGRIAVIVDEASMIDEYIFGRLMEMGVPILAIGDHGQLPPVKGHFNLMQNPMIRLEKIHRQAEDNPIIKLSIIARDTGNIPFGDYGPRVAKTTDGSVVNRIQKIEDWMMICGTNDNRTRLNRYMRERIFGVTLRPEPVPGDKVICLQNNHASEIFNGMIGMIVQIEVFDKHWYRVAIDMGGGQIYQGLIFRHQFGKPKTLNETAPEAPEVHPQDFLDLFDFGYCLTAHKAQGSEADNVIVYEEKRMKGFITKMNGPEAWNRWLYTAVTRAREKLIIIGE